MRRLIAVIGVVIGCACLAACSPTPANEPPAEPSAAAVRSGDYSAFGNFAADVAEKYPDAAYVFKAAGKDSVHGDVSKLDAAAYRSLVVLIRCPDGSHWSLDVEPLEHDLTGSCTDQSSVEALIPVGGGELESFDFRVDHHENFQLVALLTNSGE